MIPTPLPTRTPLAAGLEVHLLRLTVNGGARWNGKALYRAVVETARALGMAGASVFPVEEGFGRGRTLRDASSEYAATDTPVVVEVIDAPEKIEALLAALGPALGLGHVTVESARHSNQTDGDAPMPIGDQAQRVTVYLGSADTWHGHNLAVAIVERCRALGLAGATLTRGVMGFGRHSRVHHASFLGFARDLPERIEVVDRPERIAALLPELEAMVGASSGLIIVQDVRVARHGPADAP